VFGLVPQRIGTDPIFRTCRHLVQDVGEAEVGVDFLQQRRVGHAFVQNLVFGAKDVTVILREPPHAHDAVQRAARLVAVALAELTVSQREIAVAAHVRLEDQHVARTVHRLERVFALFRFGREHVVAVVVPVAGLFPQALVQDLRSLHFLVAVVLVDMAHVLLHLLPERPSLRMPEHQAGGGVFHVEQVEFPTQAAVVAFLGFFDALDVVVELLSVGPGGSVDPLQLLVFRIATPVRTRQTRQLE